MEARIINDQRQWNEFVGGSEQCNVTQSYEWGQLLTTLDGEVLYVGVVDDSGKLCAAMLLLVSRVSVANAVYFYAPRGPIIADPEAPAMAVLLNYVKALAHKYHAFMLKVEPGVKDTDAKWLSALHRRGFVANPEALHLRHEWVLDIRPDEQTLLAGMKKTWRYCVRLASRKDVTVRRGESLADINTFYTILQTTSQRDTFMIYDKSFYEKLVELYGKSQNVALFIAEYEGQALGAALLVKMGRWCWYMYGASSNEHRDRMPNHLLQWTAMRWAKEQGCWYYNSRGIPDVLEEDQPMWGVYLFKSGFGGYAMRSLETHDLAYNPLLYRLYRGWLDGRSWLKDVRNRRHAQQLEAEKQEKSEPAKDAQQTIPTEQPAKQSTAQPEAGAKPAAQKRPADQQKPTKRPQIVPQSPLATDSIDQARQEPAADEIAVPVAEPQREPVVQETSAAPEPAIAESEIAPSGAEPQHEPVEIEEKSAPSVAEESLVSVMPVAELAIIAEEGESAISAEPAQELPASEITTPTIAAFEPAAEETKSEINVTDEEPEPAASEIIMVLTEPEPSVMEEKGEAAEEEAQELAASEIAMVEPEPLVMEETSEEVVEEAQELAVSEIAMVEPEPLVMEEESEIGLLDEPELAASEVEILVVEPEQAALETVSEADIQSDPVEFEHPSIMEHIETEESPVQEAPQPTLFEEQLVEEQFAPLAQAQQPQLAEEQSVYEQLMQEHPLQLAEEQPAQEQFTQLAEEQQIQAEDKQLFEVPSLYTPYTSPEPEQLEFPPAYIIYGKQPAEAQVQPTQAEAQIEPQLVEGETVQGKVEEKPLERPEAQAKKLAEEDFNDETQKMPRVKMAQKYAGAKRPQGPNSSRRSK